MSHALAQATDQITIRRGSPDNSPMTARANVRRALYEAALVAIRFNPPIKDKYRALRDAGKPAKVAIIAIMRTLIVLANALLRDNRMWTLQSASPTRIL